MTQTTYSAQPDLHRAAIPTFLDAQSRLFYARCRKLYPLAPGAALKDRELASIIEASLKESIDLFQNTRLLKPWLGDAPLHDTAWLSDQTIKNLLCTTAVINGNLKRKAGGAYELTHSIDVALFSREFHLKYGHSRQDSLFAAALGLSHDICETLRDYYASDSELIKVNSTLSSEMKLALLKKEDFSVLAHIIGPCWKGSTALKNLFIHGAKALTDPPKHDIDKQETTIDARLDDQIDAAKKFTAEESVVRFADKLMTLLRDIHSGSYAVEMLKNNLPKVMVVNALPFIPDDAKEQYRYKLYHFVNKIIRPSANDNTFSWVLHSTPLLEFNKPSDIVANIVALKNGTPHRPSQIRQMVKEEATSIPA